MFCAKYSPQNGLHPIATPACLARDSGLALVNQLDRSDWGLAIFALSGDGLASGQAHGSFFDV
jgi:hypothetical protein